MDPTTPWSGELEEGTYKITMPSIYTDPGGVDWDFVEWEDGSTNPIRTIDLFGAVTVLATYEEAVVPPPLKGYLQVHAFVNSREVAANGEVIETGQTFVTPVTIEIDPGTYTVKCVYDEQEDTKSATVAEGQTVRLDFQFTPTPLFPRVRGRLYPYIPKPFDRFDDWRTKALMVKAIKRYRRRG